MADSDLNLLTALDALLAEGSVLGAARRLRLSSSAMSRTLARLREATGDPLLIRAGRGLVRTPRASEMRERVRDLVQDAQTMLRPAVAFLDLAELKRSFTIRSNEGFVEVIVAQLVAAVTAVAPSVRLHFAPKPDKDVGALREGLVDLEIGVLGKSGPEVLLQALFRDHFVGAVRDVHPLLGKGKITPPAILGVWPRCRFAPWFRQRSRRRSPGCPWPHAHGGRCGAQLPSSFIGCERIRSSGAGD
jgi:DNA-binding transcriptional LysR family regulator